MTRVVFVDADGMRLPIGRARVAEIVRGVLASESIRDALISVAFVSKRRIAALNRVHLGRAGATDVMAFAFNRVAGRARRNEAVIGDIYVAPAVARANAAHHRASVREELVRLVVHGVLHVLGYDHPEGEHRTESRMWRRQESLVRRLYRRDSR